MKKIILLVAFLLAGTTATFAQDVFGKTSEKKTKKEQKIVPQKTVNGKVDGAGMVFEKETIDYGTVAADSDGKREFVFTNNGNKPLIITNTAGSCGCTVPTTPKEPIAPGKKGVIVVKYATDRAGQAFDKQVTVTSNAVGQPTKVLHIKGNVLARPAGAAPVAPKS